MSRKHRHHEEAAARETAAPETDTTAETAAETAAEATDKAAAAPAEDPIARLESEVASLKDQLLRALAETENIRRRAAREREDAVKYAAVPLVRDLVGVSDNLRRALASVPAEAVQGNEQLKTLLDGVEMTEKELQTIFARHHIERFEPMGERLDPHVHEAVFEIADPTVPAGTVLQVLQAGYRLRDRLIRPAQVALAKGGPNASASRETNTSGDGGRDAEAPGRRYDTSA